jgi:hypothetical protein
MTDRDAHAPHQDQIILLRLWCVQRGCHSSPVLVHSWGRLDSWACSATAQQPNCILKSPAKKKRANISQFLFSSDRLYTYRISLLGPRTQRVSRHAARVGENEKLRYYKAFCLCLATYMIDAATLDRLYFPSCLTDCFVSWHMCAHAQRSPKHAHAHAPLFSGSRGNGAAFFVIHPQLLPVYRHHKQKRKHGACPTKTDINVFISGGLLKPSYRSMSRSVRKTH